MKKIIFALMMALVVAFAFTSCMTTEPEPEPVTVKPAPAPVTVKPTPAPAPVTTEETVAIVTTMTMDNPAADFPMIKIDPNKSDVLHQSYTYIEYPHVILGRFYAEIPAELFGYDQVYRAAQEQYPEAHDVINVTIETRTDLEKKNVITTYFDGRSPKIQEKDGDKRVTKHVSGLAIKYLPITPNSQFPVLHNNTK